MEKRPPGRIPGKFEHFATAMDFGGSALGLLVTCVDGRPIKVEGNPKHPYSLGATEHFLPKRRSSASTTPTAARTSSSERAQGHLVRTWENLPCSQRRISPICAKPAAKAWRSSPITAVPTRWPLCWNGSGWNCPRPSGTSTIRSSRAPAASRAARLARCGESSFVWMPICSGRSGPAFAIRGTSPNGRTAAGGKMNRLYVVETRYTITGAVADHRLALRPSEIAPLTDALRSLIVASSPSPFGRGGGGEGGKPHENRLVRRSPHPNPLPKGEGTGVISPLSKGEGTGVISPLPQTGKGPGVSRPVVRRRCSTPWPAIW